VLKHLESQPISVFCSSLQIILGIDYHTRYISRISVDKFLCKWSSEIEYDLWIHFLKNDHLKFHEALPSTLTTILLNFLHYPIVLSYIGTIIVWKLTMIPSKGTQNVKMLSLGTAWRQIGVVEAQSHSFLTSPLDRAEWSSSLSGRFTPGRRTPVPIQQGDEGVPEPLWNFCRICK
jgi:hypothetical protein